MPYRPCPKFDEFTNHPGLISHAGLVADIGAAGRIVADNDDAQAGRDAMLGFEGFNPGSHFRPHFRCGRLAVNDGRTHADIFSNPASNPDAIGRVGNAISVSVLLKIDGRFVLETERSLSLGPMI